jgi:excisionase family DNA binding protein
MRIDGAAQYIGLSVSMVRKLIREGRLETARIGTAVLVLTRSLDRLLSEGGA